MLRNQKKRLKCALMMVVLTKKYVCLKLTVLIEKLCMFKVGCSSKNFRYSSYKKRSKIRTLVKLNSQRGAKIVISQKHLFEQNLSQETPPNLKFGPVIKKNVQRSLHLLFQNSNFFQQLRKKRKILIMKKKVIRKTAEIS